MENNSELKRSVCEVLLRVLSDYQSDQFGKRLWGKIESALPGFTLYLEKDKKPSSFQKHEIRIWGNGIEYNDSLYFSTYHPADWNGMLQADIRNRISGLDKDKENWENIQKVESFLGLLEDEAKRIQGKCKEVLKQGGIDYVPADIRKKYPTLFRE